MRFVLLTSKPDSPYADTATSYEYPTQYRRFFEPLQHGEEMLAIIYEPLDDGRGRKAYVGWAALRQPPARSPRLAEKGAPLWEVRYVGRMQEFPNPVPRDYLGEPIERWLREVLPVHRNVRTSGQSVRFLGDTEGRRILELGHAAQLTAPGDYAAASLEPDSDEGADLRTRRLVSAVERDARFREAVIGAYEFRCAVSGFGVGAIARGRSTRLIDAAHIRPVGHSGPDVVSNGLALTPTLHRLFDEGLFSLRWLGDRLEVVTSPHLEPTMIESPDGKFRLPLSTGLPLVLPGEPSFRPSRDQVRYHQRLIFKGPESLTA